MDVFGRTLKEVRSSRNQEARRDSRSLARERREVRDLVMLIIGIVLGMIVQGVLVIIAIVKGKLKITHPDRAAGQIQNRPKFLSDFTSNAPDVSCDGTGEEGGAS